MASSLPVQSGFLNYFPFDPLNLNSETNQVKEVSQLWVPDAGIHMLHVAFSEEQSPVQIKNGRLAMVS